MMKPNDPNISASMLSALQNANSILLCTHISPDGDAIGATLAMGHALRAMGKRTLLACADPVPARLRLLPGADAFVTAQALERAQYDAALAIDAADEGRLGDCAAFYFRAPVRLQIDHHPTNPLYAMENAVDGDAAAAGCVVYRALKKLGAAITHEIAQCLYCAISLDTGNFCFRNTTAEAFDIMAELMRSGLDIDTMARPLHLMREAPHVLLLGRALNTLRLFAGGKCACMCLTAEDYRTAGALPEHSDGIVNYAINLPGVEMAYLADARKREETKVSLRATARYDVADIAARFGGGGHAMAAGCRIPMPLAAARAALEAEMRRRMEEA